MKVQKSKRKITTIITILCLGLAVLGISFLLDIFDNQKNSDDEEQASPIQLDMVYAYQNSQWNAAIEKVIQDFEGEHSDIVINYEVSYEDKVYEDILSKKIARNELGDIVQLKTPEPYAAGNLLGEISDDVAGLVSSTYSYDGKIYGIGAVESTWGIVYNKEIFERFGLKEPDTYDDFINICKYLKRKGITPIGVGGSDLWHMEYWVNHFFRSDVLSVDEDWLKKCEAGEVSWTDEEPGQMMDHLYQLFQNGYVNENWLTTTDTSLSYKMTQDEFAMIYTGPWTALAIEAVDPDMELGWFYVPDSGGAVYAADNLDTFWSVTASCAADEEKYAAAMEFLSYFYSQDVYKELCRRTYTFPLSAQKPDFEMDEVHEAVWEDFSGADRRISVYIGNEDTPEDFEKNMLEIVRKILSGDESVENGLQKIQDFWDQCSGKEGTS